jgi:hypothetical protein
MWKLSVGVLLPNTNYLYNVMAAKISKEVFMYGSEVWRLSRTIQAIKFSDRQGTHWTREAQLRTFLIQ